ncbi:hypothetical protein PoB_005957700 [Plakobranchus ocellatus]|uniref:Uncharacterized protein n=1 Tax=Plakobranchus ocellatus TaxID=259542 RepID=A0AAV4CM79_9GAST|nr:hypothetical protein PoB_005957700 [Plakobranchus ocellatus]
MREAYLVCGGISNWIATCHPKHWPTLETAVHVSNNTCLVILCFFGARAHQVGCDFHLVEASELSIVFYSLALCQWLCWIREGGCHHIITHNSTDRCRAYHEASLVTQIIRLTCRWIVHSRRRPTLEATRLVMANMKD